jgi:hypothetical protein
MTTRADFTDEEWERLGRAPLVAGLAISLADPGGPIEAIRESSAALQVLREAAGAGEFGPFVQAVARDAAEKAARRENPMGAFRPSRDHAREDILAELRAVSRILDEKLAPGDAADFRDYLKEAAQRAAKAAREGGFLGIGGTLVSEREQQMLDDLGEIFGAPRGGPPGA